MATGKAIIGVSDVYYALLVADAVGGATWQAAVQLPGITEVGVNPNGSVLTLFADNGPAVTANSIGEIEVSLKVADLTQPERSVLLGHARSGGVVSYKTGDISPEVAIGFKTLLSDGTVGFVWLLKGKFAETAETYTTKTDKIEFQVPSMTGKFSMLTYNDEYKKTTRSDDPDYIPATGTNWFANGPLGTTDSTAPTVATAPLDAAVDVAVTANFVWTFSEAIMASDMTDANFFLMEASDGTLVAGALNIGTGNTVVTLDPTQNLGASTTYIAVCTTNIRNLAGIPLAANNVASFTTA